jgi:hypothetical protein
MNKLKLAFSLLGLCSIGSAYAINLKGPADYATEEYVTNATKDFPTKTTVDEIKTTADTAKTKANEAKTTADNIATTANEAKITADTAKTTANEAKTTADTAKTTANEAKTTADNIATTANEAKTKADAAKTTANEAKTTADTAKTTAHEAKTTANEAKTTADNIATTANEAKTTADEAKATSNTNTTDIQSLGHLVAYGNVNKDGIVERPGSGNWSVNKDDWEGVYNITMDNKKEIGYIRVYNFNVDNQSTDPKMSGGYLVSSTQDEKGDVSLAILRAWDKDSGNIGRYAHGFEFTVVDYKINGNNSSANLTEYLY